jgi:hypothetical protein
MKNLTFKEIFLNLPIKKWEYLNNSNNNKSFRYSITKRTNHGHKITISNFEILKKKFTIDLKVFNEYSREPVENINIMIRYHTIIHLYFIFSAIIGTLFSTLIFGELFALGFIYALPVILICSLYNMTKSKLIKKYKKIKLLKTETRKQKLRSQKDNLINDILENSDIKLTRKIKLDTLDKRT